VVVKNIPVEDRISVNWVSVKRVFGFSEYCISSSVKARPEVSGWFLCATLCLHTHPSMATWCFDSASFSGWNNSAP